jgi:molybdopterin guanine dinucleotide-containing S/N-oxide reductase-like protein
MSEEVFTSCTVGGPISVYVRDGKIVRVRPLVVDEKDLRPWTIEDAGGRKYSPPLKTTLQPFALTERDRVYAHDRIRYPMKRVDFDPNGDRHTDLRGKSHYERISWDEALDIVAGEIKRIQETYGPAAVSGMTSSHANWGLVGYKLGLFPRFFNSLGYTEVFSNPDSWEGWHWGATHSFGFWWRLGMPESYDLLEDALKYSDIILYWGCDPDSTQGCYGAQDTSNWRKWFRQAGKKQIHIDPYYNASAASASDKWIAPRPGTDAALALAIAYVWLVEDTYDKDYLATHSIGFEEFRSYVLGAEDGVAKTPEWASRITDVSVAIITALAKEWAAKRVMVVGAGQGGPARTVYATEWARLVVLLQAMQGLGKPGVSLLCTAGGAPFNADVSFPGYGDPDGMLWLTKAASKPVFNPVEQRLYRLLMPDAVLDPPVSWLGEGLCAFALEQQFKEYTYPMPGYPEIKMFYRYGSSFMGTMSETNKWVKMYQSPKLEFVVSQDCWWGGETGFADIVLPACTNLERDDIAEMGNAGGYVGHSNSMCNYRIVVLQKKCIDPLFESKPDYEIFTLLAKRLGIEDSFTDGKTDKEWVRALFEISDVAKLVSWDEFEQKGYYIIPVPEEYKPTPALRWFYEGRECDTPDPGNPKKNTPKARELGTSSGKIEFESQSLKEHFPDDRERPPVPHFIPNWEGFESEQSKKYPLQLISPHARYSFHTHHDKHSQWLDRIPGHRISKNGYSWKIIRLNEKDAEARDINHGDIVKVYNDRGAVLGLAQITGRVRPGTVHSWASSAKYDPLEAGKFGSIDRGGCTNILTPSRMVSANAPGMVSNSCLVEIARWDG